MLNENEIRELKANKVEFGINLLIPRFELVNIYGCKIGNNVKIGPFVEIQKGVTIGNNVKIQSHTFIPEGVFIQDNVFIGHGVIFINDKYPESVNQRGELKQEEEWKLEKTYVKSGASIGSNATILCGITIGNSAIIGAGSVVTKDIPSKKTYAGVPAKEIT